eukprot:IDg13118t1
MRSFLSDRERQNDGSHMKMKKSCFSGYNCAASASSACFFCLFSGFLILLGTLIRVQFAAVVTQLHHNSHYSRPGHFYP